MLSYIWLSLGGAIGSAARFWISGLVGPLYGQTFHEKPEPASK